MDVKVADRGISQSQYCYNCFKIYEFTMEYLARLTYQYYYISTALSTTLSELLTQARIADTLAYESDIIAKNIRKESLYKTYGILNSLDSQLTIVTKKFYEHPESVFTTITGKKLSKTENIKKLNHLCNELGCLIADTKELIKNTKI